MTKPFKLAPSYADKYGSIDGYGSADERGHSPNKEAFLTAGKALLRRVAHDLAAQGWSPKISANRAGPAVSGEVYLNLTNPRCDKWLLVEVCTSSLRGSMGRLSDGAMVMVQIRQGSRIVGGNFYLSADLDSNQLAAELRKIIEKEMA